MESCSHADIKSAQQSTEPSSAFTDEVQRMALGNMFGLSHHPSVSDSSYPTAWLQGKEKLQCSTSNCIDSSGYNLYPHKGAVTHFTGPYLRNIHCSSISSPPSMVSPNFMMDESPFSMVGFKPFLTLQKMEVVVADEARTQPPETYCACYHYQSRTSSAHCDLGIFNIPDNILYRLLHAASLHLHPKAIFLNRKAAQLACSLTMRQDMPALAACTQSATSPCQANYFN